MQQSDPQYPMWAALLRWSLTQHDPATDDHVPPAAMDDEKRAFLEAFMKEHTVDYAKRLCFIMEQLAKAAADADDALGAEDLVALLEELENTVDQLDWARDMCKLGGMQVIFDVIERPVCSVRVKAQALVVVASAAQNDEPVQRAVSESVGLDRIVKACAAALAGGDDEWARAGFAAVSAVVRGYAPFEEALVAAGAADGLISAAIARGPTRLGAKAAFFLKALIVSDTLCEARLELLQRSVEAAVVAVATTPQSVRKLAETDPDFRDEADIWAQLQW
ncbi:hypothetical protein M885DRAFT_317476 [Pelagophyceae sp. CCMP2097]|nr:hypothetical protein M885DRAFT_317476 [Pelagophyceae sp. CCMP2097]